VPLDVLAFKKSLFAGMLDGGASEVLPWAGGWPCGLHRSVRR
jgi:hypothetical protein